MQVGTRLSHGEVSQLYKKIPGTWVLLKPDNNGKQKVKVLKYSSDREVLRDYVLEKEDWDDTANLIYFFTGYDGTCKI